MLLLDQKPLTNQESLQTSEVKLPSFSIVFETENLCSVELENIYRSLASIAAQEVSPETANEFLIIDGGYAPDEVIDDICSRYSWVTVHRVPGISYYAAKMLGATLATGNIVVYCDSDCDYVSNWLKDILTAFSQDPCVNTVAGETSTPVRNPYELAIAMHYFFPRFTGQTSPFVSNSYFLNAVAFRRNFLLQNPIPTTLPLYRGNCAVHYHYLCSLKGHRIWTHPLAKATHEPPTLAFISWRYLLRGSDRVWREILKSRLTQNPEILDNLSGLTNNQFTPSEKISGVIKILRKTKVFDLAKIGCVLREDSRHLLLLPLAIPFMLWFELLFAIGSIITYIKPDLIRKMYYQSANKGVEIPPVLDANFPALD